ncbi:MAG: AzlC family ABC transporter permease [Syntrophomonadaceae bacterium]
MSGQVLAEKEGVREAFGQGCKAGIPIAIGYLPIGMTFGLLARSAGIPDQITILMSLAIFAGASQFVAVNMLALGSGMGEVIFTTFVLNLRHLLMSASLAPRIEAGSSKGWLSIISFGITDETFSVASTRPTPNLNPGLLLGLNLTAFTAWNASTWIGLFIAGGLPVAIKASMGIALYVMFIALLAPACRQSKAALFIAVTAMAVNSLLTFLPALADLSSGIRIVTATVIAALLGAFLSSGEEARV